MAMAAKSSGLVEVKDPLYALPTGVLAADTTYTFSMVFS
jgi:hypothetical protein